MQKKKLKNFISNNYPKFILGFLFVFLLGTYVKIFAIGSPYNPGDTLDPACAPGEVNCIVQILPDQTGNAGEYLTTDGTTTSWASVSGGAGVINHINNSYVGEDSGPAGDGTSGGVGFNIFLGDNAGNGATNVSHSNFFGKQSGDGATDASFSNFFGNQAGSGATNAINANFFGPSAGSGATNAEESIFIGFESGLNATDAGYSVFLGNSAGYGATNAGGSNFIGQEAGLGATNAIVSNFFGVNAGDTATNATGSNFFGNFAGHMATNASNSIFIGTAAGNNNTTLDNTGSPDDYSILLGQNTSTGGFSNSIAFGASATNTSTNQFMLGSSIRPINQFVINGINPSLVGGTASGNNLTFSSTSDSTKGKLLFGTSAYDEVNNRLGLGTITPAYTLEVTGDIFNTGDFYFGLNTASSIQTDNGALYLGDSQGNNNSTIIGIDDNNNFIFFSNASVQFSNYGAGTALFDASGNITSSSDERLKDIQGNYTPGLTELMNLNPILYKWNALSKLETEHTYAGFSAQNVQANIPYGTGVNKDGYLSLQDRAILATTVNAIKEMNIKVGEINNLNTENTFRDSLVSWFANATNRIARIFTGEICLTDPDGSSECINKTELHQLKKLLNVPLTPADVLPSEDPLSVEELPPPDEVPPQDPGPIIESEQPPESDESTDLSAKTTIKDIPISEVLAPAN